MDPLELNKEVEQTNNEIAAEENQITQEQETAEVEAVKAIEADVTETEKPVEDPVAEPEVNETVLEAEIETVETVAEVTEPETAKPVVVDYSLLDKSELIEVLKALLNQDLNEVRDEVEKLKQAFYKKQKAALEEAKRKQQEADEDEDSPTETEPIVVKDERDDEFRALMNDFKTKRAALTQKEEAQKEDNLLQKQHVLEQMKKLVESNDDVSSHINEFRDLQKKWKSIGQVPAPNVNDLWKQYSALQESFWDLVKINNEMREYDFKKNLEAKTLLCEAAEKLAEDDDVINAFKVLQKLHDDWRETGPVSREYREDIWERFKDASAAVNKKHQGHFDEVRKLEEDNLVAKTALCEKIEQLDYSTINTYKGWDDATQQIMQWQEEWRTIGFAPRKMNHRIFERYRAACDAFFNAKSSFYKDSKKSLNENLEKKKALCEKAEALKDSQDWKEASEEMIKLQKEWKTVGPVIKKYSDEIWKRFITACDYFFEQKKKNTTDQRGVEQENLQKKKALIEKISGLAQPEITDPQEVLTTLRQYIAEWGEIGFVPFRDKDKIYKEYRETVDKMFEMLNVDTNQRRLDTFKSNLKDMSTKGENKLYREREKLVRAYEHLKSEIATYENNIGFLTAKNKKGSSLITEMVRKIDALKEEADLIEKKIGMIEENL